MKRITNIGLLVVIVVTLAYTSCRKFEKFPLEPEIKYDNFLLENDQNGVTRRGVLVITYTDGDGDLGLAPGDTLPPYNFGGEYYYNMIIKYFEMHEGEWEEVHLVFENLPEQTVDTLTFNARIPVLTPITGNQAIKGFIQDTMFLFNPLSKKEYDTIKFSVYIIDRALNKSNTVETPAIIVKRDTTLF